MRQQLDLDALPGEMLQVSGGCGHPFVQDSVCRIIGSPPSPRGVDEAILGRWCPHIKGAAGLHTRFPCIDMRHLKVVRQQAGSVRHALCDSNEEEGPKVLHEPLVALNVCCPGVRAAFCLWVTNPFPMEPCNGWIAGSPVHEDIWSITAIGPTLLLLLQALAPAILCSPIPFGHFALCHPLVMVGGSRLRQINLAPFLSVLLPQATNLLGVLGGNVVDRMPHQLHRVEDGRISGLRFSCHGVVMRSTFGIQRLRKPRHEPGDGTVHYPIEGGICCVSKCGPQFTCTRVQQLRVPLHSIFQIRFLEVARLSASGQQVLLPEALLHDVAKSGSTRFLHVVEVHKVAPLPELHLPHGRNSARQCCLHWQWLIPSIKKHIPAMVWHTIACLCNAGRW
mmetsp:Transcript_22039/g.61165  ORF Transcript_22039/g.61165 Transcript_22039/m.61165 type:complete len:393 (-) Transcript_22039:301-1479(-)